MSRTFLICVILLVGCAGRGNDQASPPTIGEQCAFDQSDGSVLYVDCVDQANSVCWSMHVAPIGQFPSASDSFCTHHCATAADCPAGYCCLGSDANGITQFCFPPGGSIYKGYGDNRTDVVSCPVM